MGNEVEEMFQLEKYRTINMGLASNPITSGEFIKSLIDELPTESAKTDEEWITPQSVKEIEEFLQSTL